MLYLSIAVASLVVQPHFKPGHAQCQLHAARVERSPVCGNQFAGQGTRRETRFAPVTEIEPGQRYREAAPDAKFYQGRDKAIKGKLATAFKDIGKRKVVVVTGASSGLGLFCVQNLLLQKEGYTFDVAFTSRLKRAIKTCW